jgi:hypothetical protein
MTEEEVLSPEQRAKRKRLRDDFEYYAKHCVKIRTKQGKIAPLVLNRVQKRFLQEVWTSGSAPVASAWWCSRHASRVCRPSSRQFQYWWLSQRKAQKGLVMAHEGDSTTTLLDMYRRIHDNVPDIVRPQTKYLSRNELNFDKLDSGMRVATAGGRGIGRGETLTFSHLSEVAFWPVAFANTNFNGLVQAIPDEDDTFIFLESTAQGVTGKFYDMYQGAVRRDHLWNGYEVFFSAWFESNEYRSTAPADFVRTPEEENLITMFTAEGLTSNDQLYWRRKKIGTSGIDLFKQEYPATAEEAFLSTGRPIFNTESLNERLQKAKVKPALSSEDVGGALRRQGQELPLRVLADNPVVSF